MPDIPFNPIRDANLVKRGKSRRQKVVLTIGDNKYTIDEFKELTVGKDINGIIITGKNIIMKLYNSDGCKSRVITEDRLTKFISDLVHQGVIAYPEPWCLELRSPNESMNLINSIPSRCEIVKPDGSVEIVVLTTREALLLKMAMMGKAGNIAAASAYLKYDDEHSNLEDSDDSEHYPLTITPV